jgi:hypothetical protein
VLSSEAGLDGVNTDGVCVAGSEPEGFVPKPVPVLLWLWALVRLCKLAEIGLVPVRPEALTREALGALLDTPR